MKDGGGFNWLINMSKSGLDVTGFKTSFSATGELVK